MKKKKRKLQKIIIIDQMKQWIKNARHFPLPNNKRCAD